MDEIVGELSTVTIKTSSAEEVESTTPPDDPLPIQPHRPSSSQTWLDRLLGVKISPSMHEVSPNEECHHDSLNDVSGKSGSKSSFLSTGPMLNELLKSNRRWAKRMKTANPKFFETLVKIYYYCIKHDDKCII